MAEDGLLQKFGKEMVKAKAKARRAKGYEWVWEMDVCAIGNCINTGSQKRKPCVTVGFLICESWLVS